LFFSLLLPVVPGCAHLATPREKEISYRRFASLNIRGIQLGDFLRERTAVVVSGARPKVLAMHDEKIDLQLLPVAQGEIDVGYATCVAMDGYYLTAAHCLPRQPIYLLTHPGAWANMEAARIVWSPPAGSAFDLSLIKIDAKLPAAFDSADIGQLRLNDDVVTIGSNGLAGGKLLRISDRFAPASQQVPSALAIYHSVPLTYGDSGGPLTTPDGKLIGIEVLARGDFWGSTEGIALQPDPRWLAETIGKDRARGAMSRW
jgi:hypothetical protein